MDHLILLNDNSFIQFGIAPLVAAGLVSGAASLVGNLINVLIMRSFAYKNENFEKNSCVPELREGNPCYQASVYDPVMYDETPDGDPLS